MATKPDVDAMDTHRDTFPALEDDANERRLLSDMTPDERSRVVRAQARRIADERKDLLDRLSRR